VHPSRDSSEFRVELARAARRRTRPLDDPGPGVPALECKTSQLEHFPSGPRPRRGGPRPRHCRAGGRWHSEGPGPGSGSALLLEGCEVPLNKLRTDRRAGHWRAGRQLSSARRRLRPGARAGDVVSGRRPDPVDDKSNFDQQRMQARLLLFAAMVAVVAGAQQRPGADNIPVKGAPTDITGLTMEEIVGKIHHA
jgi:hypothetical protein